MIRRLAPAKLNLYLHVTGRRADGYHLLDSLVAFADVGDEIRAVPADHLSLAVTGPAAAALVGPVEDNLVWRAAERLARHLGRAPGAALTLVKNLPVASGIGGGSSDAAATLLALAELWGARIAPESLAELGAELGADVPVCLAQRASWVGGIGERIDTAPPLPTTGVVLANPNIPLATPAVFKARTGPFSARARFAEVPSDVLSLALLLAERRNDLVEAALSLVPEIAEVLDALLWDETAYFARMSGSGATCFALFPTPASARAAAARLAPEHPGWWIAAGTIA